MSSYVCFEVGNRNIQFPDGLTDFWLSFYVSRGTHSGSGTTGIRFRDSNFANDIIRLMMNGSNLALFRNTGTTSMSLVTQKAFPVQTLARIDLHVKLSNPDGLIDYYYDGEQVGSYSGNTVPGNWSKINEISFQRLVTGASGAAGRTCFSGIIISDSDTREISLSDFSATGDGDETSWVGDYTDLDTSPIDGEPASSISAEDAGLSETFVSDFSALSSSSIIALVVSGQAREEVAGEAPISPIFKTSGGGVREGQATSPGSDWAPVQHVFNDNAGVPWDYSDISSGEFGFLTVAPT